MLPLQKFLLDGRNPADLGINVIKHSTLPLIKYKYNQIDSSKYRFYEVVKNARGIILDNNHVLIGKGFDRFYNYGECKSDLDNFNWNEFACSEKIDGSIIILVYYENNWIVTTSGGFGDSYVNSFLITFQELFNKYFNNYSKLNPKYTYIFEIVGPENKIVRSYPGGVYLLSIFAGPVELSLDETIEQAHYLNVPFPPLFQFNNIDEIINYLTKKENTDPTWEGFVLRDSNNIRIKIKNKSYLTLHRLKGNNNPNKSNLIKLILTGELSEIRAYFPELDIYTLPIKARIDYLIYYADNIYSSIKHIDNQKEFASYATLYTFAGLLFNMRKLNCSAREFLASHLSYTEKLI